jgi:hypothetical protein
MYMFDSHHEVTDQYPGGDAYRNVGLLGNLPMLIAREDFIVRDKGSIKEGTTYERISTPGAQTKF